MRHGIRHAGHRQDRRKRPAWCGCGRPRRRRISISHGFNRGDYVEAVEEKAQSETLSRVLYPNDSISIGPRVAAEAGILPGFRVAAGHPASRIRTAAWPSSISPDHVAIQLNDTHPVLAIAELMRLLVDVHGWVGTKPGSITVATFAFTNHTLLSEALEIWPVAAVRVASAAASADHLRDQCSGFCVM